MAEFCWDCLQGAKGYPGMYPEDPSRNDFYGACKPGETIMVLCETHGFVRVDHEGKIVRTPGE